MKMESEAEAKSDYNILSKKSGGKLGALISVKKNRKPLLDLTNFANPNSKSSILRKKSNNSSSSIGSSNFNAITDPGYKGRRKDVGLPLGSLLQGKIEIGERTSSPNSYALSSPLVEKTKDRGKASTAAHVEKTKDRGKTTIAAHVENTKSRGKAIIAPHVEKTKDKGKAVDVASKVFTGEKKRDKSEGVTGYISNHAVLKIQSKGEGIALSRGNISLEGVKEKGKKSVATPDLSSLAKPKDKGKIVVTPVDFPTVEKRKEIGQRVPFSYSCPSLPKSRQIRNGLNESEDNGPSEFHTDPHMMHKKKRRCLPRDQCTREYNLPEDFIEKQRAYFKEVDEFELLEEEASDNEK